LCFKTISNAQANEVTIKRIIRLTQCPWLIIANAKAVAEIKNINHAAPRYFLF